jgi:adenylylsulfate kinase
MPARRAPAIIVWLTGPPAAGKTTLARALRDRLAGRPIEIVHDRDAARLVRLRDRLAGQPIEILDGDEVRPWLSSELGFSRADRDTNIRRIARLACLLARNGVTVLVAAVSPYASTRAEARDLAASERIRFLEIFVRAAHETRVARDPKGMYARALRGELAGFTGVSDPYEEPGAPELVVDTDRETVEAAVERIVRLLG